MIIRINQKTSSLEKKVLKMYRVLKRSATGISRGGTKSPSWGRDVHREAVGAGDAQWPLLLVRPYFIEFWHHLRKGSCLHSAWNHISISRTVNKLFVVTMLSIVLGISPSSRGFVSYTLFTCQNLVVLMFPSPHLMLICCILWWIVLPAYWTQIEKILFQHNFVIEIWCYQLQWQNEPEH